MAAPGHGLGKILGLGFLFGAKDTGVGRVTKKMSEGFEGITNSVSNLGSKTAGLLKFSNAIGVIQSLQLSRITNSLEELGEKAGVGVAGQANQIESFGATFAQTFRQARAGMGAFGKELDKNKGKISGTAFSLQVSADDLTNAVAEVAKTGSTLKGFGISVRTIGGSMQAGILGGKELVDVLTSLSHGYDLGDKGATALLDKQTKLGEAFGVGADAVKVLPEVLKAADPILAKFTNLKIDNVTESLTRLAIASQKRVGGTFQTNMESAIGVINELGQSREQMAGLITGISSDFPEMAKELSISSGDVGASMQSIMSDPLTFAKNMQKLNSTLAEGDPKALRLRLALSKMGPGFQFLVQGGEDSAKALDAASVPIKNFGGSFSKMVNKASGNTRTFAENMEVLKDTFDNSLRKMTSQTDSQVLHRQKGAYDALNQTFEKLRKQGGVSGTLTQAFLDIRRHGLVHGLLPTLEKMAQDKGPLGTVTKKFKEWLPMLQGTGQQLLHLATTIGPMLLVLGHLGVFSNPLVKLLGPLALIGSGAWFVSKHWDKIGPVVEKTVATFANKFANFMGSIDWEAKGKQAADFITKMLKAAFGAAGEAKDTAIVFGKALRKILGAAWEGMKGLGTGFWDELSKELGTTKAAATVLGLALFTPLRGAIIYAISTLGPMLWSLITGPVLDGIGIAIGAVSGPVLAIIAAVAAAGYLIYDNWDLIGPAIGETIDAVKDLFGITGSLDDAGTEMSKNWSAGVTMISDKFKEFGKWFKSVFPAMMGAGASAVIQSLAYVRYAGEMLGIKFGAALDIMGAGWSYVAAVVKNKVIGAFEKVERVFTSMFESWDTGFLTLRQWLYKIPLELTKMIKSIGSSTIGSKLLGLAGFDVADTMKGIDKQLSYWQGEYDDVQAKIDDRARQSANAKLEDIDREGKRQREVDLSAAALDAAGVRMMNAKLMAGQTLDKSLAKAEKTGLHIMQGTTSRMAAGQPSGVVVTPTPAPSPAAKRQSTRAAAAAGGAGGLVADLGLSKLWDSGMQFSDKGQQQIASVAAAVVSAANKRMPRASPNGGDQVP